MAEMVCFKPVRCSGSRVLMRDQRHTPCRLGVKVWNVMHYVTVLHRRGVEAVVEPVEDTEDTRQSKAEHSDCRRHGWGRSRHEQD